MRIPALLVESVNVGSAQTSQEPLTSVEDASAVVPSQVVPGGRASDSPQAPLMSATTPAVAGLKPLPDMRIRRLIGVSAWALTLAVCGLLLGTVGLARTIGEEPAWFEPAFIGTGVFGLLLAIAAFATVQIQRVPWLLLGASTVTFAIGVILLSQSF